MIVGNGTQSDIRHDRWCGETSLKDEFPGLFEICNEVSCAVKEMGT